MKLLLLVAAVIVAASAKAVSLNDLVIDPNWIHTLGKKEENFNLAEIVANIGNVVHVIDSFVSGAAAKREVCFTVLGAKVCTDPTISGKREENINLAEIVANIGKVVHVIDGFVSGVTARDVENINLAEIVANIGKVVHVIDGFVSGVTARDVENFNLSQIVANLGNVIHVIDGFVSGAVAKREVCFTVLGAKVCTDPTISGKREENINLAEIVANIGKVVHVIDGFVSGVTARDVENINLAEIVANIGKVVHVIDGFVSGVTARDVENINLAEIVANIGKVVHVIEGFVSGTTTGAKREEQDICLTISGINVCV